MSRIHVYYCVACPVGCGQCVESTVSGTTVYRAKCNSCQPGYTLSKDGFGTCMRKSSYQDHSRPSLTSRFKIAKRSFYHSAPVLWKSLPSDLRLVARHVTPSTIFKLICFWFAEYYQHLSLLSPKLYLTPVLTTDVYRYSYQSYLLNKPLLIFWKINWCCSGYKMLSCLTNLVIFQQHVIRNV